MEVDIYVKTAKDATYFNEIFYAGICNLSSFTRGYLKEHPEIDRNIKITYHIGENEKK